MNKASLVAVNELEVCDRTRVRHQKPKDGLDVVMEYAEAYQCGLIVEPLDVFREKGTERYLVADGEHRLLALRRAKVKEVECRLHEGDEIAALDFAIGCNQTHGLRRTDRDRYHALTRIMETSLRDKYRTDTELSEKLGVSISTVKRYKAQWRGSDSGDSRVQKKKQVARAGAEKKTTEAVRSRSAMVSRDTIQPVENQVEISAATRIEPIARLGIRGHSDGLLIEFSESLAVFGRLPPASEFRGMLNGHLNWDDVVIAHEWLSDLLADR